MYNALYGDKIISTYSPLIGNPAPELQLESFGGEKIDLESLKGKTVLLNFWASWCNPCKQEAAALESSYVKLSNQEIEFIGINVMDDMPNAINYIKTYGGSFINGFDPNNKVHLDYGVEGVPETYFISPDGIVTDKYRGPLTEKIISFYIKRALEYKKES
ncbi:MAG: redoxin domain-containing protein [Candidatus Dadabacteria bacterium]|nr:redoxin domain-containing protein [Candidatus Dadabacteria bacterium]NIQ16359.1 redoxin domain-containing protein [Candidatus Dadabacteria bacterium]